MEIPFTHEQAVELALQCHWLGPGDKDRIRTLIETHFESLFAWGSDGFQPLWRADARELLITWETP